METRHTCFRSGHDHVRRNNASPEWSNAILVAYSLDPFDQNGDMAGSRDPIVHSLSTTPKWLFGCEKNSIRSEFLSAAAVATLGVGENAVN